MTSPTISPVASPSNSPQIKSTNESPKETKMNTQTSFATPSLPSIASQANSPSSQSSPTLSKSRDFLKKSKLGMGTSFSSSSQTMPVLRTFPTILPQTESKPNSNTFPSNTSSNEKQTQPLRLLTPQQQHALDQEHRKNISSFKSQEQETMIFVELDHLLDITKHETNLIEHYKTYLKNTSNIPLTDKQSAVKKFNDDMKALAQKKSRALGYVLEGHNISTLSDSTSNGNTSGLGGGKPQFSLHIAQQPAEIAVANRYLLPAPQITTPTIVPCGSTFVVCASLAYHGSSETIEQTIDGKQEVLQGIKRVTVDSSNHVIFTKLKIMEVSSKHRHQPFCLIFTLEEYRNDGKKEVLSTVKSVPFHVQSRPNKRKSTGSLPPAKRVFFGAKQDLLAVPTAVATSSLPNLPTIQNERDQVLTNSTGSLSESTESPSGDYNYIDITDLLILPQKEAARRLGISESMLCKRFKECTRRKWPYRYLRKIDKVISMLEMQKNEGVDISNDDLEKLEKLTHERVECLKPVRIRITTYDKVAGILPRLVAAPSPSEDTTDAVESLRTLSSPFHTPPEIRKKKEDEEGVKEENKKQEEADIDMLECPQIAD